MSVVDDLWMCCVELSAGATVTGWLLAGYSAVTSGDDNIPVTVQLPHH
jgi:hypothetical protein